MARRALLVGLVVLCTIALSLTGGAVAAGADTLAPQEDDGGMDGDSDMNDEDGMEADSMDDDSEGDSLPLSAIGALAIGGLVVLGGVGIYVTRG